MSGGLSWFQHPAVNGTGPGEAKPLEGLVWHEAQPLGPERVSMTPSAARKLGAVPPRAFELAEPEEFPIMARMVHEVIKRENDEYREALRKLLAEEAPAHPREEECMGNLLAAADRYADVYRITLDEALNVFAKFLRVAE